MFYVKCINKVKIEFFFWNFILFIIRIEFDNFMVKNFIKFEFNFLVIKFYLICMYFV